MIVAGREVEPRSITLRESRQLHTFADSDAALVSFCCGLPYDTVESWLLDLPVQAALAVVRECLEVSGYGDQKSDPAANDAGGARA